MALRFYPYHVHHYARCRIACFFDRRYNSRIFGRHFTISLGLLFYDLRPELRHRPVWFKRNENIKWIALCFIDIVCAQLFYLATYHFFLARIHFYFIRNHCVVRNYLSDNKQSDKYRSLRVKHKKIQPYSCTALENTLRHNHRRYIVCLRSVCNDILFCSPFRRGIVFRRRNSINYHNRFINVLSSDSSKYFLY